MTPTPEKAMTAKERAKKCLPVCHSPGGQECIDTFLCELHYRVTKEIEAAERQAYRRGVEDSAYVPMKYLNSCTDGRLGMHSWFTYSQNIAKAIRKLAEGEK